MMTSRSSGKERDSETGLDYFGARYYGSNIGRFASVDPVALAKQRLLDPQQLNLYGYVRNNPLTLLDPTGETIECKTEECRDKLGKYLSSLDPDSEELKTFNQLNDSETNYVLNFSDSDSKDGKNNEGEVGFDGSNVILNVNNVGAGRESYSLSGRIGHELEHGRQVDNGELGFLKDSKGKWKVNPNTFDLGDEMKAFDAQVRVSPSDAFKGRLSGYDPGMQPSDKRKILIRIGHYSSLDDTSKDIRIPGVAPGTWIRTNDAFGRVHP